MAKKTSTKKNTSMFRSGLSATLDKTSLARATDNARRVADDKDTMPLLGGALVEAEIDAQRLRVTATDLVTFVTTTIPAQVAGAGSAVPNAKDLHKLVSALPVGEVEMDYDESGGHRTLRIWTENGKKKSSLRMITYASRDFPAVPNPGDVEFVEIPAMALRDLLGKTLHAASHDDTRPHLQGVHLDVEGEDLVAAATDGNRLAVARVGVGESDLILGVVVPSAGAAAVLRHVELEETARVAYVAPWLFVRSGAVELAVKTIDLGFPDYRAVIPKESRNKFEVDANVFAAALRRSAVMESVSRGVRFDFEPGRVVITAQSPDIGEMREEVAVDGSPEGGVQASYRFNPRFLLEIMSRVSSVRFRFELGNSSAPIIVRAVGDDSYLGVVMPMLLDG